MNRESMRTRAPLVGVVLVVFGAYSVLLGLFMLVAPGEFWSTLGAFGPRNDHYIFDNASFELPLGLLLLAATRWRSWRVPALAFATAHWALHAISHFVDTDHAKGQTVGWLEFAGLAFGTVVLAVACAAAWAGWGWPRSDLDSSR
jgi:peptidoglycan/LPS O-acetylase OafA/YrhL